jgi:hypothetical protein
MQEKEVTMKDEMEAMKYEPLDETEMKLIKWSLGLGVVLLVVFFIIAKMIPAAH